MIRYNSLDFSGAYNKYFVKQFYMLRLRNFAKYGSYIAGPTLWYYVGTYDKEIVKRNMFNRGFNLSQKFKQYPIWDNFIEPAVVRRSSIVFAAGNSFIKGMISDNQNTEEINKSIAVYKAEIEEELKDIK